MCVHVCAVCAHTHIYSICACVLYIIHTCILFVNTHTHTHTCIHAQMHKTILRDECMMSHVPGGSRLCAVPTYRQSWMSKEGRKE